MPIALHCSGSALCRNSKLVNSDIISSQEFESRDVNFYNTQNFIQVRKLETNQHLNQKELSEKKRLANIKEKNKILATINSGLAH